MNDRSGLIGRRQAIQLFGAVGALGGVSGAAAGSSHHAAPHGDAPASGAPMVLDEAQFALLSRLTELIIPKTDTAGAIEAGVPGFIDEALSRSSPHPYAVLGGASDELLPWDSLPVLFSDGLRWIDERAQAAHGKEFLELDPAQQLALLEARYAQLEGGEMLGRGAQFLRTLKELTVEGYYTSREGLLEELGYSGNTASHTFSNGCKS